MSGLGVIAESAGEVVLWSVHDQWSCTCGHAATNQSPSCAHVIEVARRLTPRQANELISARRRAGYIPANLAQILARETPLSPA